MKNETMYDIDVTLKYDVTVTIPKQYKDDTGELACLAEEELKQYLTTRWPRRGRVEPHTELPVLETRFSDQ